MSSTGSWDRAYVRRLAWVAAALSAFTIVPTASTARANSVSESTVSSPTRKPSVAYDSETGTYSLELSVLTYNVAGLPWPFLKKRAGPLEAIGKELRILREQGNGPDIVLIQEGFRKSTSLLVEASGYPNWVKGPEKSDEADESESRVPREFKKRRNILKGELFGRIMNSGLYVLSEWPIESKITEPFHRGECAGFDCGANKGILWAEIAIPGMPGHIQMLTTHFNSRGSSGASNERTLMAHNLQFAHTTRFLAREWDAEHPFIFGGDFNIKDAPDRIEFMESESPLTGTPVEEFDLETETATGYCLETPSCDHRIPLDDGKLGVEKQDWQGFSSGKSVQVKPISVNRLFHTPNSYGFTIRGRDTLSDHDGLLVRYRLSWKQP